MTQLRQKMLEEHQRRHYAYRTANTYIRIVRDFAAYFHRPPDKLGPETHSPIPGISVSKQKVVASYCQPVCIRTPLLVCQNSTPAFSDRVHSFSQISPASARRAQP